MSIISIFICHIVYMNDTHIYYTLYIFIIESQEGKPIVNGDNRFMMNLSQDQKEQYGSQFEGDEGDETPGILGEFPN